jgi:hypothetical protein
MKDIEKYMQNCESAGVEFSIQALANSHFEGSFIDARTAYLSFRELYVEEYGVDAWAALYAAASLLSRHPNFVSMDLNDILDDEALKLRLAREVEFRRLLAGVENVKPFPVIHI